jgi:sulfonate transport system substrate-binding protein
MDNSRHHTRGLSGRHYGGSASRVWDIWLLISAPCPGRLFLISGIALATDKRSAIRSGCSIKSLLCGNGVFASQQVGVADHPGLDLENKVNDNTKRNVLATDEIQIGNFSFSAFPIAVANAGLSDLRIIADEIKDGVPGFFTDQFVVRKDSPIRSVEDLKGKVLATNVTGSGTDIPLRAMLLKHNLKDKADLTIIEVPNQAMQAMLLEHKVDLRVLTMPDFGNPKLRSDVRTLFTQADAMGVTQLGMWVAHASFIKKHRTELVDFLEDALRQERWYYDPANHRAATEIAAKITKLPAEQYDGWLFRKNGADGDYYRDLTGTPNVAAVQSNVDEMHALGFLKARIDVKQYVDLSLVAEAAKRLQ